MKTGAGMSEMPIPCGAFSHDDAFKSESRPCPQPARWLIEDWPMRAYRCDEHKDGEHLSAKAVMREVREVVP